MEYEYLLTKCKCGNKFHSDVLGDTTRECVTCTSCIYPNTLLVHDDYMCSDKVKQFLGGVFQPMLGHGWSDGQWIEGGRCKQCGVKSCNLRSGVCRFCFSLGQRGKCGYSSIYNTRGFPMGIEIRVCEYCDNKLHSAGENSTCFGCYIEPFNIVNIKPVKGN